MKKKINNSRNLSNEINFVLYIGACNAMFTPQLSHLSFDYFAGVSIRNIRRS